MFEEIEEKEVPVLRELLNNIAGMFLNLAPSMGIVAMLVGLTLWALPFGDRMDMQGKQLAKIGLVVFLLGTLFNSLINAGESIGDAILP